MADEEHDEPELRDGVQIRLDSKCADIHAIVVRPDRTREQHDPEQMDHETQAMPSSEEGPSLQSSAAKTGVRSGGVRRRHSGDCSGSGVLGCQTIDGSQLRVVLLGPELLLELEPRTLPIGAHLGRVLHSPRNRRGEIG